MGCKLSIHVSNPQEEALTKKVEELRQAVADLQAVVVQQTREKGRKVVATNGVDKPPLKPARSKNLRHEQAVERSSSVSILSTSDSPKEEEKVFGSTEPMLVASPPPSAVAGEARPVLDNDLNLRVHLQPTQVVTLLLQSAHKAETNALEYLLQSTDNHVQAAQEWRAYQVFRSQYDSLLHGETFVGDKKNGTDTQEDDQEGGLLHFLGLPQDLDDKQGETADIKAIEDSLDWRDDTKKSLVRYRVARLAHMERVEDAIVPRLEALQAAAEQEDPAENDNDNNNQEDDDIDLSEMTKHVLFTHVLKPFCANAAAFESFVCYVTRALERTGPNKSAIRPFQNAIKAMASSVEQAELYKSWITHTRRNGILMEKAAAAVSGSAKEPQEVDTTLEQSPEQQLLPASQDPQVPEVDEIAAEPQAQPSTKVDPATETPEQAPAPLAAGNTLEAFEK